MKQVLVCIGVVVENMSTTAQEVPVEFALGQIDVWSHTEIGVLIARRKSDAVLGGYWELPGGKVEPDESHERCLCREFEEELGVHVQPMLRLAPIDHVYEHAHVRLLPFVCRRVKGIPQPLQVDEVQWVRPADLSAYAFPPPNAPLIAMLGRVLGCDAPIGLEDLLAMDAVEIC